MPIPVLIGTGDVLAKNSITFRSLNINNAADEEKDTYLIEDVSESDAWQQVVEPFPDRDGSNALEPFVMSKIFRVRGWVRSTSMRKLYDKIETINKKFHPVLCYNADTSTYNRGYLPLSFNVPTDDTTNYATGLIPSLYYVQALRPPVSQYTKFLGLSARIDFLLRAADPRRYLSTSSSGDRVGNGTIVLSNVLADYPSYPIITIVTTSAPSGTPTIARTTPAGGTISFTGAQLAGATTYILDLQAKTFKTAGGTDKSAALVGGSNFSQISEGASNTWTLAGWPADVAIEIVWVRAFL